MEEKAAARIRSFVIRAGRSSEAQKRSYETLFPLYRIVPEQKLLNFSQIFGNENPVVIEIGFGMGTATAHIAEQNPAINYVGIDVHRPGIGKLAWEIDRRKLTNLRIIEGDAAEILANNSADASISAFHIFFPDPWQKKRHHKRRLLTRPFTNLLARKLLPGAYLYFVSDWADYAEWALAELSATAGLENKYEAFAPHQEWRAETEFERKGLKKNHEVQELMFTRSVT